MTVLVIRAHKRFGVCRGVALRGADGSAASGLLIEVSLEGCRISNLKSADFAFEERVEVQVEGWKSFCGQVRWQHGGMIGLRLTQPLHHDELARLIHFCRAAPDLAEARRA